MFKGISDLLEKAAESQADGAPVCGGGGGRSTPIQMSNHHPHQHPTTSYYTSSSRSKRLDLIRSRSRSRSPGRGPGPGVMGRDVLKGLGLTEIFDRKDGRGEGGHDGSRHRTNTNARRTLRGDGPMSPVETARSKSPVSVKHRSYGIPRVGTPVVVAEATSGDDDGRRTMEITSAAKRPSSRQRNTHHHHLEARLNEESSLYRPTAPQPDQVRSEGTETTTAPVSSSSSPLQGEQERLEASRSSRSRSRCQSRPRSRSRSQKVQHPPPPPIPVADIGNQCDVSVTTDVTYEKMEANSSCVDKDEDSDDEENTSLSEAIAAAPDFGDKRLHDLIILRNYDAILQLLGTDEGRAMAAVPHPTGDLPLHMICSYDRDYGGREEDCQEDEEGMGNVDEGMKQSGPEKVKPPSDVILALLGAFPGATKKRGYISRLPLHHAARLHLPKQVVLAIIRAFPQGLDVRDANKQTPRDFDQMDYSSCMFDSKEERYDLEWNALLDRPSSCWLQQLRDEEARGSLDDEMNALEEQVFGMMEELEVCLAEEVQLNARLTQIEAKASTLPRQPDGWMAKATKMQNSALAELEEIGRELDDIKGKIETPYAEDEKERKYIELFNEDVAKVYENSARELEETRCEMFILRSKQGVN